MGQSATELYASSAKAKELLGWEAQCSDVNTLLSTTYAAYRANLSDANLSDAK